ncbi:MAG: hypothetical protein IPK79_00015 [Vampirovibrionales bacterium]|nr:hypothetical protein [Vampirovibrionales bacterium]
MWGQVSGYNALDGVVGRENQQSWTFTLRQGSTGSWTDPDATPPTATEIEFPVGSLGVDFGQSGQGMIQLSTIDRSGAPYIRFARWAGANPYTPANVSTDVQIGNLSGLGTEYGSPVGDYGIFAAGNGQTAELSDQGIFLRNAAFTQYSGANMVVEIDAGDMRLGSDLSGVLGTGFSFTASSGDVVIGREAVVEGQPAPQYLKWERDIGLLTFTGTLVVAGSAYSTKDSTLRGWVVDDTEIVGQYDGVDQIVLGTNGNLSAGTGAVILSALGIGLDAYDVGSGNPNPTNNISAIAWWNDASAIEVSETPIARIWGGIGQSDLPAFQIDVNPGSATGPRLWIEGSGGTSGAELWFSNISTVVGLPGLYLVRNPTTGVATTTLNGDFLYSSTDVLPNASDTYDLGSTSLVWRRLYVNELIAGTIAGGTQLTGQIWQYDLTDMYIRSNSPDARTLYVTNPGTGTMHLNVEGNIALGGTVDGVDIAAHAANANAHHAQSHVLATTSGLGADHTVSGLTAGQVLRASGATAAVFAQLQHSDLGGITANDHHNQSHVLATASGLGADHTVSGLTAGQVLRASGATAAVFAQLQHSDLGGITADQHHAQSHVLATASGLGADHTVSGLTAGQVLRASGATAAVFAQLQHSDLGGITANDHHNQSHVLATASGLGADHTVSGLTAGQVLRAGGATTAAFGVLDHSELSGLTTGDPHTQYVHISIARAISAQHTFNPATAGAPFTLGANAQGRLVTGLNADQVDGIDMLGTAQYQALVTGASPYTPAWTSLGAFAGAGLLWSGGQYQINAGPGIVVTGATRVYDTIAQRGAATYASNTGSGTGGSIAQRGTATSGSNAGTAAAWSTIAQRGATTTAAGTGSAGGYNTIAQRGTATSANSYTNSLSVTRPTGVVENDVLVAVVTWWANTLTPPSGWTQIGTTQSWSHPDGTVYARAYYRVAGASEPSSYAWGLSATNDIACTIVAYSNVDTTDPISASGAQTQTSASMTAPGVDAATTADMLIFLGAVGDDNAGSRTATPPSGMTELADTTSGTTWIKSYAAQQLLTASGATGTRTATLSASARNAGFLVSLRPTGTAGGDTEVTVNRPTGVVENDVMLATVVYAGGTLTAASGWTQVLSQVGTGVTTAVYRRTAGASEASSYTWGLSTADGLAVAISAYSGVNGSNPIADSNSQANASSASMTAPGVTPASSVDMLVFVGGAAGDIRATAPGSMTEDADTGTTGVSVYMADQLLASGDATGTRTATLASAAANAAGLVSLRPVYTAAVNATITVNAPTGVIDNDVLIATVAHSGGTLSTPAGWTAVRTVTGSGVTLATYRRVASSEPANYTWSLDSADTIAVAIAAYTNVDTAAPIDAHDGQANASSTSMTAPAITTTETDTVLLFVGGAAGNVRATVPGGMTELVDTGTGAASVYVASQTLSAAGSTGTRTATLASAAANAAILLALAPTPSEATYATVTVDTPTGVAQDDALIAIVAYSGGGLTAPVGWTPIRSVVGTGVTTAAYLRIAGASEPANSTWSLDTIDTIAVAIAAFDNVDTVVSLDDHDGQANASSTSMTAPALTTTIATDMLLFGGGVAGNVRATPPSGMTELVDTGTGAASVYLASLLLSSAGDTSARTATLASAAANAAVLLALAPSYTLAGTPAVSVDVAEDYVWTGAHTFASTITARHVLPQYTDSYDLGSETLWWRQQFVSQINAVVFAKQTVQLFGGGLMVTKNAVNLPAVGASQTQIDFGQSMTPGDFLVIRSHDAAGTIKVEYMTVGGLVSGTTYNVTRDVAGAHVTDPAWADGTPAAVLGQSGNGRLEMNAYTSPRLSMIVQGATYSAQSEYIRLGDLNGMPGVTSTKWGIFIGDASQHLRYYDGSLVIAGNGSGLTSINGGNITTGTVTLSQLSFTPVQTNNVVASINATAEGIRIAGSRISIDGNVTFSSGYDPTTKITAGGAAADVNANTTTISGGRITTGSITATQIAAGTITTSLLNFTPVQTNNVVASINATAEGIRISGSRISIDGNVTFSSGYDPTTKITAGGAAADVNANTTTISGGKITTGSITAAQIAASTLTGDRLALTSYLSINSNTFGADGIQLQYNSGNPRAYIGNGSNRYFQFDGTTITWQAANAQLDASGNLTATNATLSGTITATSGSIGGFSIQSNQMYGGGIALSPTQGITVYAADDFSTQRGVYFNAYDTLWGDYFNIATLHTRFTPATASVQKATIQATLGANLKPDGTMLYTYDNDTTLTVGASGYGGARYTQVLIQAKQVYDTTLTASISLFVMRQASPQRSIAMTADNVTINGNPVWHAGNDGPGTGLNADVLDGYQAAQFALLTGATFTGSLLSTSSVGYDWSELTPVNNWVNYGGTAATLGIKRFGNMVSVKGRIRANAAIAANVAVNTALPTEYRPAYARLIGCLCTVAGTRTIGRVIINTNGLISPQENFSLNDWVSLEFTYFTGG